MQGNLTSIGHYGVPGIGVQLTIVADQLAKCQSRRRSCFCLSPSELQRCLVAVVADRIGRLGHYCYQSVWSKLRPSYRYRPRHSADDATKPCFIIAHRSRT
jgi:hypothetical protein